MNHDPMNFWMQIERLERLIRAAELKAGLIFSFHSLILGLLFERIEIVMVLFDKNVLFFVFGCLWIVFVIISIFYSIKCFRPQMELKYDNNVFFFKDTVYNFGDIKEYSSKLISVCKNEDDLFQQLSEQIHAESKIIDVKFKCVQNSIKYLAISFVFVALIIALWLIKYY